MSFLRLPPPVSNPPPQVRIPSQHRNAILMGEDGEGGVFEVPCIVTSISFEQSSVPLVRYNSVFVHGTVPTGPISFTLTGDVREDGASGQLMGIQEQRRAQDALQKMQGMLDNRLSALREIEGLVTGRAPEHMSPKDILFEIQNVFETTDWEDPK